ncbi:MAG: aryl-sulfate sulfotransferase [Bacteroidales bacterium]|nr:aryl-sulfate sulfotransferase [Bacteroidales bacterium]
MTGCTVEEHENSLRVPISLSFSKPCTYHIDYWKEGEQSGRQSTEETASAGKTERVTVMFLYPETNYEYQVVVKDTKGQYLYSEVSKFTTGSLPVGFPEYTVSGSYPTRNIPGYILQWQATKPGYISFCDTEGKVVWYEVLEMAVRQATYDEATKTVSMLLGFKTSQNDPDFQRWGAKIVLMDLEGNRTIDLTAASDNIDFPHHEIKRMPDGNIAILHGVTKQFDLTSIGGEANTTIYGDGITIVTPQMEKIWSWDCFCELDPLRDEYLDAVKRKNDLIHANSISWDEKGNLYMTVNFLNELWKIDRKSGKVLYRVGDYGNVTLPENGHASGLHAGEPQAEDLVLCLDNGSDIGTSRAVMYKIDSEACEASVELSVAIPSELSSRDRSNCHFTKDKSMLFFGSTMGRASIFTDLDGNVLKVLKRTGISYRSYYYETIEY